MCLDNRHIRRRRIEWLLAVVFRENLCIPMSRKSGETCGIPYLSITPGPLVGHPTSYFCGIKASQN
jgi:hypothetical protein